MTWEEDLDREAQRMLADIAAQRELCMALGIDPSDTVRVTAEMSAASPIVDVTIERAPVRRRMSMEEWAAVQRRVREARRNA